MCVGDCSRSPEVCKEKGIAVVANRPLDGFYLGCRGTARFTSLGTMGSELNTDDVRAAHVMRRDRSDCDSDILLQSERVHAT